jgi:hypothetical protein
MSNESGGEVDAVGWDAISGALDRLYPGQEAKHYATTLPYSLGGRDPIDGISVYETGSPDHWHYVTLGFSELYEKETDEPSTSGYGFELTLRMVKREREPPVFAMNFLQNLARYVFDTGRTFRRGDHMELWLLEGKPGGPWVNQQADNTLRWIPTEPRPLTFARHTNGELHVAWIASSDTGTNLRYGFYDGCNWTFQNIATMVSSPYLAVDPSGRPHIAFEDRAHAVVAYAEAQPFKP